MEMKSLLSLFEQRTIMDSI